MIQLMERFFLYFLLQTEISKRLSAIITQIVPFLQQEHQQQVLTAVERAKQITMSELNAVIGVSNLRLELIAILLTENFEILATARLATNITTNACTAIARWRIGGTTNHANSNATS